MTTRVKLLAAIGGTFAMLVIGTCATSREERPADAQGKVSPVQGALSPQFKAAQAALNCPQGTALEGGDGALRSSYGCARPGDPKGKFHGPYGQWYRNGQRAVAGQFDEWKQTGEWTWWRADGTVDSKVEYQDGLPHGTSVKLAKDGSVIEKTEFNRGEPVGLAEGEAPRIQDPSDISCTSVARRAAALAREEMGTGIPGEEQEAVAQQMDEMRSDIVRGCAVHLSAIQRKCMMVVRRVTNMRWCQGAGPKQCEESFGHVLALLDESALPADDLETARTEVGFTTRSCLAEAVMTKEMHGCITRTKTLDELEGCADLSP